MAENESETLGGARSTAPEWDVGGLRATVTFRAPQGATLRLFGPVDGSWEELLRFDDFVDGPHFHAPASADPVVMDRELLGDPLEWFLAALKDHSEVLLVTAGYGALLPKLDLAALSGDTDHIRDAMTECLPDGYQRVPGKGLQRVAS